MKSRASFFVSILFVSMLWLPSHPISQALSGKSCTKIGLTKVSDKRMYVCEKLGKKKVWSNGADLVKAEIITFIPISGVTSIPFSFIATKGDSCDVTLTYENLTLDNATFQDTKKLITLGSFQKKLFSGLVGIALTYCQSFNW